MEENSKTYPKRKNNFEVKFESVKANEGVEGSESSKYTIQSKKQKKEEIKDNHPEQSGKMRQILNPNIKMRQILMIFLLKKKKKR